MSNRHFKMEAKLLSRLPWFFMGGLLLCWVAVILVDMLNIGGLGEYIIEMSNSDASTFVMLFGEARPVEWMQWTALTGAIILAAQVSTLEKLNGNDEAAQFSLLIAILFAVLLMEDAGNLRHNISHIILSTGVPQPLFSNFYRTLVYVGYAIIPIYAVGRYGSPILNRNPLSLLFWSGFIVYAIAALISASAPIGNWYEEVGSWLNQIFFGNRAVFTVFNYDPGYWIMDYIVEESLELIAATLFLSFFARYKMNLVKALPFAPPRAR